MRPEEYPGARGHAFRFLRPRRLLPSDGGAARAVELHDFVATEAGLTAPAPEIRAGEVEGVAELDEHVERHHHAERVLAARIVDEVLDCDERPARRQCFIRE